MHNQEFSQILPRKRPSYILEKKYVRSASNSVRKTTNLFLSSEVIKEIGNRREIEKRTFGVPTLRQSESGDCGLCVVSIPMCWSSIYTGREMILVSENDIVLY